jgi:uncharacterized protein (DUF736 family)
LALIGIFTPTKEGGWTGTVRTLAVDTRVKFVPNDNRSNERSPHFRVCVGTSELGAAWHEESRTDQIAVVLDDPGLPFAISATLYISEDGGTATLCWRRSADSKSGSERERGLGGYEKRRRE